MNPSDAFVQQTPMSPPVAQQVWLLRGVAVVAAALLGLGVVMWIAANWQAMGRVSHFALLQGLVLTTGLGAAALAPGRAALGLLCFLGTGALFAYFGQTYQTGADPWQLFALWAVLALPLCLATRSDVLWAPWALVAATAISLWTHTHSGHRWEVQTDQLQVHLLGWSACLALAAWLSPAMARLSGAGLWSFRLAVVLVVFAITLTGIGGLLDRTIAPQYPLGVLVLAVGFAMLCVDKGWDVFAASAVALGLNGLLVAGLVRWLFDDAAGDWIGRLLLLGLLAAGLLAVSVSVVMRIARKQSARGATA